MIKLLIFVILILVLVFIYRLCSKENFHEKTKAASNQQESLENCQQCSYCDFKPNPNSKEYIISRCLQQHTQSDAFIPTSDGCKSHEELAFSSGCNDAIKNYMENINNLRDINSNHGNLRYNYSIDNDESSTEKISYNNWIKSFLNPKNL